MREGFIEKNGFRTWYGIEGNLDSGCSPLLALNGGPGCAHDYMETLLPLAKEGLPIVYYDQLGCGRSSLPGGRRICIALFLEELSQLRQELGLEKIHLLGHSWGSMLAMEHALAQPGGIQSLILSSGIPSLPLFVQESRHLARTLPPAQREAILQGREDSDEYAAGLQQLTDVYCDGRPPEEIPPCARRMPFSQYIYELFFHNEFTPTSLCADWEVLSRLPALRIPTLLISGALDESTPYLNKRMQEAIAGSQWILIPGQNHSLQEAIAPEFNRMVLDFLQCASH